MKKTATNKLLELDKTKSVEKFGDGTNTQFHHTDMDNWQQPTGISTEEGDLLYGLVRIIRPEHVLETGSNIGVSASYICLALQDNNKGDLTTIEFQEPVAQLCEEKLKSMGFTNFSVFHGYVEKFHPQTEYEFIWLDTEFKQRYAELLRFYHYLKPGGIICIHDLPALDFAEFGGVPDEMKRLLKCGDLRALTFMTAHGVTVFQKRRNHDHLGDIIKEK